MSPVEQLQNECRFCRDQSRPGGAQGCLVADGLGGLLTALERFAGGEVATAWNETPVGNGRRVILSIADSFPGKTASAEALATVKRIAGANFESLLASHRNWWHEFYPRSFVSIPDPKLESFYWIQFYKLASASRPHLVPVDLLGPWYRRTGWPRGNLRRHRGREGVCSETRHRPRRRAGGGGA